jgi:hypothetical protein
MMAFRMCEPLPICVLLSTIELRIRALGAISTDGEIMQPLLCLPQNRN